MKNLRKIAAVALVIALVMSFAACSAVPKSLSKEWAYKTDSKEYSVGVYVYSLFSAYNQAYSVITEAQGESFDSTASILDIESTFDETGETYVCRDWVLKEADAITKNLLGLDMAIEEYGVELDETVVDSAYEQARVDWNLGPYYEEYLTYGYQATPYKDMLEPFGISLESFYESSYLASVKQTALFNHFYNKGGIKEVPESELKDYFEDNYTSYSYFSVNLYESSTDANTGQTVNKALPEEKVKEIKENLDVYAKMIKNGISYDDVSKAYTAYAELEYNPTVSNTENLSVSTSLGTEVQDALKDIKEGAATVVYVGQEDSTVAYFVYKRPITDETKTYLNAEANYNSVLNDIKGEEFVEYVDGLTEDVECELNSKVIAKFDPAIFEEDLK